MGNCGSNKKKGEEKNEPPRLEGKVVVKKPEAGNKLK